MRYIITLLLTAIPAASLAEAPRVVTDIPPVHSLVAQVMGELGQPELLLARGADEHDFQLKPSQARAVAEAGLVVWIGPELTPWLDSALAARPEGAAALALLDAEGTHRRAYGEADEAGGNDHAQDHADDHAQDHADDQDHGHDHGHDHGAEDPHAWLDPGNAQVWLKLIAAELGRLDPEHAATYAANATAAAAGIAALDAGIAGLLAPVKDRPILTYHDAYGYFADHYGLTVIGSLAEGDAATPGAARLTALREAVADGACLFPEVQHDPRLILQLAEDTGAKIGGALDPVGSALEPGPGAYAALLRGLAATIADCAGG